MLLPIHLHRRKSNKAMISWGISLYHKIYKNTLCMLQFPLRVLANFYDVVNYNKNCNTGHRFKPYDTPTIYKVEVQFFSFAWALWRVAYFQQVCRLGLHDVYNYHSQIVLILTLYSANTALLATACLAVCRPRNRLYCRIFLQSGNSLDLLCTCIPFFLPTDSYKMLNLHFQQSQAVNL